MSMPESRAGRASTGMPPGNVRLPPGLDTSLQEASTGADHRKGKAAAAFALLLSLGFGIAAIIVLQHALEASAAGQLQYFVGKTTRRLLQREGHAFEFWLRNWLPFAFYCAMSAALFGMAGASLKKGSPPALFALPGALGLLSLFFLIAPAFALLMIFF
ncbi:hypothetical protein Q9Q94_16285 [Uliginosibacterium sp. 31-16]|uniref:hypothetical protein n=1 Tax=Uliginosibacterium sp. 31-16 TaxID=3068315 RepID=UPI00273E5034|nr:hypothetical protein [Uliginosibacterium sp. 31-16]MDP5241101.1 hypothetical protein [Uliginosibacterium sp. 31-16]